VINGTLRTKTPVNIVALSRNIHGSVPFIGIAKAVPTPRFSTAIIVGNNIALAVFWILAGANPRDWGHFRSWWAGIYTSATAGAQKPINGAISPIIATLIIS
tara:strand:- start:334 stop:639 length:306 start_codon:yes stop_codon:yes gene_type:complete